MRCKRMSLLAAFLVIRAATANAGDEASVDVTRVEPTPATAVAAPPAKPGLTVPAGRVVLTINIEASLAKDRALEPVSAAPDVSYGVTRDLTLSLVHSGFLATGFRGNAGGGVCLTGEAHGCAKLYPRAGLEGWYSLARGTWQAAAVGGLYASPIDPLWTQAKLGARTRWQRARLFATWMPSLFIGLDDRDAGNQDAVWSPWSFGAKLTPKLSLAIGTGFKGPLEDFADRYTIAAGVIGQLTIDPRMSLGASFFVPNLIGGSAVPDAARGSELRFVQLWVAYTL